MSNQSLQVPQTSVTDPWAPAVVVSGSYRKHLDFIGFTVDHLRQIGFRVLAPLSVVATNPGDEFVILQTDDRAKTPLQLEIAFLRNLRSADLLVVANLDGYLGLSAAVECAYAALQGISILFCCPVTAFGDAVPTWARPALASVALKSLRSDQSGAIPSPEALREARRPELPRSDDGVLLRRFVVALLRELKTINT